MTSQNFSQRTIRYFRPIFSSPLITFKALVIYTIWAANPVVHVMFIQKLVSKFELWGREEFIDVISWYALYVVLYEIIDFSMKKWWWVENINAYRKTIDKEYIEKFISVNNNDVEKQGTGKLVSIITNGSDTWSISLDLFLLETTRILLVFIFSVYMFSQVGIIYWLAFISLYVLVIILWAYFNNRSLIYRRQRMIMWNMYVKTFVRILMSKVEIMQSSKTQMEISKIHAICDDIVEVNKRMAVWVYACYRIAEFSVTITKLGILFYVGLWVFDEKFSLAFFVWLFWVMTLMESTITQSMKFFRNFTKDFTKIEQFWNFFDNTPQMQWYETWKTFTYKKWEIVIQNISYAYDENKAVFRDFSLEIPWKQITAFVWPSGGGKSTLVKLLAGYIMQDTWRILVDAQKLADVSLKSYYKDIWYLTQEPSVFDGTVRDNLLYAVQGKITDKKVKQIIKLAHCEFIYDLSQWLDTEIGERWIKLSGWQKQRLAIAKIFLKDPKIIILDEPTSALDSLSEQKITQAMHNLFAWRSVIIIAHRLQTVKHAHDIIVIEAWKIIERGTHKELIKKKWYYKQMLDLQSGF